MNIKAALALWFLLSSQSLFSQQSPVHFGNGLFNLEESRQHMDYESGYAGTDATTEWENHGGKLDNLESNFYVSCARLKFDGFAISPQLEYKIELGLSNRDISGANEFTSHAPRYILDAVVKWNFYKNFILWFGQAKLPGNRERVISSAELQQVDRSLVNRHFNIDRDLGIQLRHHFYITEKFLIRDIFSISQGEGRNITSGNLGGHQYTGRVELLPMGAFTSKGDYRGSDLKREPKAKLSIGVSFDHNNSAVRVEVISGLMITDMGFYKTNINTLFVDGMFKYKGFSLMWEYADRNYARTFAHHENEILTGDVAQVGKGINLQSGFLSKNNWELSGRFTNATLDREITGKAPENQYT